MFSPSGLRYVKWLTGIVALALLVWAGSAYRGRAARLRFADRIFTGYEKNVSLTPILAPLEARLHQAMIPDIGRSASSVNPRLFRILKGIDTEEDRNFMAGSNWTQAAYLDDYREMALGAEAWAKVVGRIMDQPDTSTEACADRLRNWPPALLHFNQARAFDRKFLARVVKQTERDAARVEKGMKRMPPEARLLPAAALYEAGVHFRELPASRSWRDTAEKAIRGYLEAHQKSDGSVDGNPDRSLEVIAAIMPPLAAGYRAGIPVSQELATKVQNLLEVLMYSLDMNGCMPFVPLQDDSANQREWLFWGGRIFQRPDFAWVAYGGLDALDVRQPSKTSQAFPDLGLYIMRNNWEIRRYAHRGQEGDASLRNMSHTLWIDARRGQIELFAFGERQVRLVLPASIEAPVWRVSEHGVVLQGTLGAGKLTVVYPVEDDIWMVRLEKMPKESEIEIVPLRLPLREAEDRAGLVSCPTRPAVGYDWNTGLKMKSFGSVCMRTNGRISTNEGQEFRAGPAGNADSLTIAITGTCGAGGENLDREAENLEIKIEETDCVFGSHEGKGSKARRLSLKENGIFLDDLRL